MDRSVSSRLGWLLVASLGLLLFLGITNKWVSWHAAIYHYKSYDDVNYRLMAQAAPGLLHGRILPEWHAERFAVAWVVGVTAKVLGFSVVTSFRVWVILLALGICLVLAELLVRMGLSLQAAIICMAVFILDAYSLRPYLLAPGSVDDLALVFGTTIAVRGLVLRSPSSLLIGLILATVARQTALPPAAVAAVAVAIDPAWRRRLGRRQLPFAAITIGIPLVIYAIIRIVSHPFAGPPPSLDTMTLLGASLSVGSLVQHFGRCINVLLSVGALLIAALWLSRAAPPSRVRGRRSPIAGVPAATLACLAFGLAIIAQPAAMNPAWASYNENRLSVLGLIPLVAALGLMLVRARAHARPAVGPGRRRGRRVARAWQLPPHLDRDRNGEQGTDARARGGRGRGAAAHPAARVPADPGPDAGSRPAGGGHHPVLVSRPGAVRIVGLDLEPISDFRTQHTRQAGVYRALDATPQFDVVSAICPRVPLPVLRLIQLAYFRPDRNRWRQRSGLSTAGFRARTLSAERILSAREDAFDVVFQVGCTFAPGRWQRRRPYTQYLDCTLLQTHRHWRAAASHGTRALRQWVSLERDVYERAHHIFTMSEWARTSVIDEYGIAPDRVTVTGAGTNLIPAPDEVSSHAAPIALFVGREFGRKGGPTLLSAWPAVAREVPEAQLWIVGTREEPRREGQVTWHGAVPADALRDLYRQASVLVLPTMYDMSPHVLREALGYGLTCVTTTVGGIPEIVRDGVDSLLVAPGDDAGLAAALVKLLSDPGLAREMGAAGRTRVLRELTWERVAERMTPHLLEAAGGA